MLSRSSFLFSHIVEWKPRTPGVHIARLLICPLIVLTDQTKYLQCTAHSPHLLPALRSLFSPLLSLLTQWLNRGRAGFPWQLLPLPVCVKRLGRLLLNSHPALFLSPSSSVPPTSFHLSSSSSFPADGDACEPEFTPHVGDGTTPR